MTYIDGDTRERSAHERREPGRDRRLHRAPPNPPRRTAPCSGYGRGQRVPALVDGFGDLEGIEMETGKQPLSREFWRPDERRVWVRRQARWGRGWTVNWAEVARLLARVGGGGRSLAPVILPSRSVAPAVSPPSR